ncbi:hypothetical protein C3E98_029345 [Pseudomonas sp. MWU13-2625]|nr:hypothetical protein C3E98_029345 [Pseudomonas sp. MWU13-2625]
MSLIDPSNATETINRLNSGKYVNAAVEYFQGYVNQLLNAEEYTRYGITSKRGNAKGTVNIGTPHGDIVLSSDHCLLAGEIVARQTFTAVHQEFDRWMVDRTLLTVVIKEDATIVRVGNAIQLAKIGPSSTHNGIIDEIVLVMMSNLQNGLPAIQ